MGTGDQGVGFRDKSVRGVLWVGNSVGNSDIRGNSDPGMRPGIPTGA